jgi:hypothetical protein
VNAANSAPKPELSAMKSFKLLMLATLVVLPSCKTASPKTSEIVRLYSLPPVLRVSKGAEIPTADGIVVVPADTLLHSHGSYMEQVQRAIRP